MIEDGKGYGQGIWNRASKLIMSSRRKKKNLDFILGTSQKLFVTFSRMGEGRDFPFFISEDAAAGCKSYTETWSPVL